MITFISSRWLLVQYNRIEKGILDATNVHLLLCWLLSHVNLFFKNFDR